MSNIPPQWVVANPVRQARAARRNLLLAAGVALAVVAGCSEKRLSVYPVSGKVSFAGKAPAGARVVLHPQAGLELGSAVPSGLVQEDGSYKIGVYAAADGAPAGDYVATVQWNKVISDKDGGTGRGPNVLPAQYASAESSPVKVTVKNEPTEVSPIEIPALAADRRK